MINDGLGNLASVKQAQVEDYDGKLSARRVAPEWRDVLDDVAGSVHLSG